MIYPAHKSLLCSTFRDRGPLHHLYSEISISKTNKDTFLDARGDQNKEDRGGGPEGGLGGGPGGGLGG